MIIKQEAGGQCMEAHSCQIKIDVMLKITEIKILIGSQKYKSLRQNIYFLRGF